MTYAPTFDEIFAVMSAASVGDVAARVAVPDAPPLDDMATKFAIALNLLLDDLAFRAAERERTVEALRESEERLQLVLQNMPVMMDALDSEGNIVAWNRECEQVTGYLAEEIIGNPRAMELLYPDPVYRQQMLAEWSQRGNDYYDWEWQLTHKDGSLKTVSWSNISARLPVPGWATWGIGVDVTERKQAEEDLKQLAAELARSNAELEQFAYIASHDLQEPLRTVAGMLQLLQRRYAGQLDARADEFINLAVDGANRMKTLITDLLAFSRVATRGHPFQPTDCAAVLTAVQANLAAAIQESGAVITHDPLPTVMADRTQLAQVFQNLISNALKFRSDEAPAVHIGVAQQEGEWLFSVRDNGIGMETQYFERIFVIFQRLHTRQEYPGTGLGLALCKKIVERHGGRIWLESQPGQGSTFYFTLPNRS